MYRDMTTTKHTRPLSPNIQIYRPQLTSVLSIANRITGVALTACAVGLVILLVAAASGPDSFATVQGFIQSWVGRILLLGCTFCFFLHFCGGIRHLAWDAGYGFSLRAIYASGWAVVAVSTALTVLTWAAGIVLAGYNR
jgi:succinate dehydrogenase / fumarate reductase cytochrome b subunit